jgi:DNA-binding transcriptional ArsR family regulator
MSETRQPRRELTDAREMRALAHPVRVALLELLGRDGPMTATQAGEALGESPANASFHLRTLAKYGFVEEAPGGTGRQRPWRRVAQKHAWGLSDDPTTAAAAEGLTRFFEQRIEQRRQIWNATRASYPKEWQEASGAISSITYLTASELDAFGDDVMALIDRYSDRISDKSKRPEGALPVAIFATAHPIEPTPAGN